MVNGILAIGYNKIEVIIFNFNYSVKKRQLPLFSTLNIIYFIYRFPLTGATCFPLTGATCATGA